MHRLNPNTPDLHAFGSLSLADQAWLADTITRNRDRFAGWRMEANGGDGGGAGGDGSGAGGGGGDGKTFTQADIDAAIDKAAGKIRADERRKVTERFADYDDLKAAAEGTKTLEDRITEMESKSAAAERRALRAEIAAEFGISTKKGPKGEASDADLFLTGSDEAAMRAQAERLAGNESDRKKRGNHVPTEGNHPKSQGDDGKREFVRNLFGRANED